MDAVRTPLRGEPFALLDDARPMPTGQHAARPSVAAGQRGGGAPATATSRLYTDYRHTRHCTHPATFEQTWQQVEVDLAAGLHAVILADYEWGAALASSGSIPLAGGAFRVLCFAHCSRLTQAQTDAWLSQVNAELADGDFDAPVLPDAMPRSTAACVPCAVSPAAVTLRSPDSPRASPRPSGIADLSASVTRAAFDAAIDTIHQALRAGDSYQVNYTFRLAFGVYGDPVALYCQLRQRQPVAFGALIRTPASWVLSVSPELFVRHDDGVLSAKPMKGTAARIPHDPEADQAVARALQADEKNRAENVMIVDLLRNDLGRIASVGSVRVDRLFDVDAWPSVWQMTSTVRAELAPGKRFPDVLRALFPCGSITGAPKHAAMALIQQIETTPRGLYTGAIGWIDPPSGPPVNLADAAKHRCGDFCLSVAIRTITIDDPQTGDRGANDGLLPARAGIGAGIVLDSLAADEYAECWLKARFLTGADPGFALFETMALTVATDLAKTVSLLPGRDTNARPVAARVAALTCAMPFLPRHLARLEKAAERLGFDWSIDRVLASIETQLKAVLAVASSAPSHTVSASASAPTPTSTSMSLDRFVPEETFAPTHRVRLALSKDGTPVCTIAPLAPLGAEPVGLLLAVDHGHAPVRADDFLLRFKTTARGHYDTAWQAAVTQGAFDMLFENTSGELTEGGRSTVYVKLDGHWYTPPVHCGLLPGVFRGAILDGVVPGVPLVRERVLRRDDLARAEGYALSNGLRGWITASIQR